VKPRVKGGGGRGEVDGGEGRKKSGKTCFLGETENVGFNG